MQRQSGEEQGAWITFDHLWEEAEMTRRELIAAGAATGFVAGFALSAQPVQARARPRTRPILMFHVKQINYSLDVSRETSARTVLEHRAKLARSSLGHSFGSCLKRTLSIIRAIVRHWMTLRTTMISPLAEYRGQQ